MTKPPPNSLADARQGAGLTRHDLFPAKAYRLTRNEAK
jgi:hypothetical protein